MSSVKREIQEEIEAPNGAGARNPLPTVDTNTRGIKSEITSENVPIKRIRLSVDNQSIDNLPNSSLPKNEPPNEPRASSAVITEFKEEREKPERMIFSLKRVVTSIWSNLDRGTLLNCRLVCRKWRLLIAQELKKSAIIGFKTVPSWPMPFCENFINHENPYRPLEDLTAVMNTSNDFPCVSFSFSNIHLSNPVLQTFLDAHGSNNIEKLQILEKYDGHHFDKSGSDPYVNFNDLKQLIFVQAPYLEHLEISHTIAVSPAPWFCSSVNVQSNLRTLRLCWEQSRNVFEEIVRASPKLQQVDLDSKHVHYLLEKVNRLHLLKTLYLDVYADDLSLLELLANKHENNFALVHLSVSAMSMKSVYSPQLFQKVTEALSKILAGCSGKLEHLEWALSGFSKALQIPPMPKLKKLTLTHSCDLSGHNLSTQFFPPGVNIGVAFPNLKTIVLIIQLDGPLKDPLSTFFGSMAPATSVTSFSLLSEPGKRCALSAFQKLLPNAKLTWAEW